MAENENSQYQDGGKPRGSGYSNKKPYQGRDGKSGSGKKPYGSKYGDSKGGRSGKPYGKGQSSRDGKPYGKSQGSRYGKPYGNRSDSKPYSKRDDNRDSESGERSEYRGNKSYGDRDNRRYNDRGDKRYGDRDRTSYGDRDGKRYGDRDRKSYGDKGGKRYGDRDEKRYGDKGEKRYGDRDRKSYGDKGGKRYGNDRSDRGYRKNNYDDRKPYKKDYNRNSEDGESNGEERRPYRSNDRRDDRRKPYQKGPRKDGFRNKRDDDKGRSNSYRDRDAKRDRRDSSEEETEYVDNRTRKFNKRRDGQRADWVNESENDSRRGPREFKHYDMVTRRDLVQIATTDASEDFVWAGGDPRHTDSEFYVNVGDPVIHETYGDGSVCKIISGKVQVEFEDGAKRWYAHPLAMSKGIILKPGMEPPAKTEPLSSDFDDFDDELAAVLLESNDAADDFESPDDAEMLIPEFEPATEALEIESPSHEDEEDLFADVLLITGDELDSFETEEA